MSRAVLPNASPNNGRPSKGDQWQAPDVAHLQEVLPQYEVMKLLGRGGMGAVYKARQKSLRRMVAIKILPVDATDDELRFAERFKNEAFALARLSHPGIVNVHDAGETEGGMLYFVMEYVEGRDLAHEIAARGRLPQDEVKSIALQVCNALTYLHGHGIVHRDIKPANILLDAQDRVKVADFGLAKLDEALVTTMLTRTGTSMGTAEFMAPECRRAPAAVDQRSDLFSVGVMIYQMLIGELPHGMFKLPSQILPEIDVRFDDIICKALEPKPEDRYQSATEIRAQLEMISSAGSARSGETQKVASVRPAAALEPVPGRRKMVVFTTMFGFMAALGVWAFWFAKKAPSIAKTVAVGSPSPPVSTSSTATKSAPFVNSLGMKFVPVPITGGPTDKQRVLFSIWETRAQDYQAFVTETNRKWRKSPQPPHPKFKMDQRPAEAAVYVSWIDAQDFSAWLTARDRKSRIISNDLAYRLPSDHEWSCAAGLGSKEDSGKLPHTKINKFLDVYPWGAGWPPPAGVGNFADQTAKAAGAYIHAGTSQKYLEGWDDGHAFIAPVGSFLPNEHGLHDLAGNVNELCQDWYNEEHTNRVQRNTNWGSHTANTLASSWRGEVAETHFSHTIGFRLVLVPSATVGPITDTLKPAEATKDVRFVNERGMKFVPVPITGGPTGGQRVLFCIWETRVQDYDWFIRETKREWRGPTHSPHPSFRWPQAGSTEAVVYVSWLDAKSFAEWLTRKDRSFGLIGDDLAYRLPTDHEWSCAVGLGEKEDPAIPPRQKRDLIPNVFAWGTSWPPPPGAGNLADQKARAEGVYANPTHVQEFIDGYDDGHAFIAPVGSSQPNRLGLHDLAGNVEEYVEDWFAAAKSERVIRGAHWGASAREFIKGSFRNACVETSTNNLVGFRVVLAPAVVASEAGLPQ